MRLKDFRHQRNSLTVPTGPRPKPTDPPVLCAARFTGQPTRHLIYHIWPHNRSDNWRWNVRELLQRIFLFDGVRSIGVVTYADTATLADVQSEFGDIRIDHWFESPNQPLIGEPGNVMSDDGACALLGEGLSFLPMLHTLPRGENDVTFYAHARGARYAEGDGHLDRHRRWSRMLYAGNLDDWQSVHAALHDFPMAGCFKRYEDFDLKRNWHWHYSGTFFWFRNADVFASPHWPRLQPAMYGQVEAWPANLFRAAEVACLFGDGAHHLYLESELMLWESQISNLKSPISNEPANHISDESFFQREVERGFTTSAWPTMLAIHRVAAQEIKDLRCRTVLEIGSGLGAFLLGCQAVGLDAVGMDRSRQQRDFATSQGVDPQRYVLADIPTFEIPRPVDAINCVEVFEHLTDAELVPLCRQLAENCRWFFFSSTPYPDEGDVEWGHVNLKTREQWIEFFSGFGLTFRRDETSLVPWGLLFRGKVD